MWVRSSGILSDNTRQVNTALSSHLLVLGPEGSALVDTSIAAVFEELKNKIVKTVLSSEPSNESPEDEISFPSSGLKSKETGEEESKSRPDNVEDFKLDYILLTHSHFDHVSALPLFKIENPDLKVICSAQTSEILSNKEFLEECWSWNKKVAKSLNLKIPITKAKWFSNFRIDEVFGSGDSLSLGDDVNIKAFSLPGHTEDTMGYFVQPDSIFQGGEITGSYGGREVISPSFSSSYQSYLKSLEKIISLEPRGLVLAHGGCLRGDLSHKHLIDLKQSSQELFGNIKDRLKQGELQKEISESLAMEMKSEHKFPEGPFSDFHDQVISSMVDCVAKDKD